MPRGSTKSMRAKPTKNAKPLNHSEPRRPPRQTEEVIAAIYYFGAFEINANAISELISSKYPRAVNVHAEDCRHRFAWFVDCLAEQGLRLSKTELGKAVKDVVPLIEDINLITQIDEQCETILRKYASSRLAELKDENNTIRAAIMKQFSAREQSDYEMCKKRAESLSNPRSLPQDNPLPPGALGYEGYNAFLGYESP